MIRNAMLLCAVIFCAVSLHIAAGEVKPVAVKFSVPHSPTGPQGDGARKLGEFIKEFSNGRMVMEFYPSAQLGDKIATMEGLVTGTIEMTETAATDLSNYCPIWSVLSLPYLWDNSVQALRTLTDPEVRAVLEKEAEELGFIIITWMDIGSRSVLNTLRPVNTPADMSGLRIRVMEDPILAGTLNAMGGSATPMPWSEVYTGLQQGTIQGLENSAPVILANGMEEVAKYFSLTEQFMIPDIVYVSKRFFERLSPENQSAILDAGKKFSDVWNNDIWANAMKEAHEILLEKGVKINEVDKASFEKAVQPVIDKFLSTADPEQKALYELLVRIRAKY